MKEYTKSNMTLCLYNTFVYGRESLLTLCFLNTFMYIVLRPYLYIITQVLYYIVHIIDNYSCTILVNTWVVIVLTMQFLSWKSTIYYLIFWSFLERCQIVVVSLASSMLIQY